MVCEPAVSINGYNFRLATPSPSGRCVEGVVSEVAAPIRVRVPWHRFDRDIERGEEIQEGKARCPGAKEEGDEEGEAG